MLPAQLARLFGRVGEVAELGRLVERERLLSLVGAPGCGKTRLAVEVGVQVASGFAGGVGFVELAPVGDPESVVAAVGVALGVPEEPGRPLQDVLVEALCDVEPVLVVLDNCEHVVDAAAAIAQHLVTGCPRVSVLATSRAALGVRGERLWSVPALDVVSAVELFRDRARLLAGGVELGRVDGAVVEEICARLDCLPLAVELAAAWSRVLSPGQILERLTDGARELAVPGRGRGSRYDTMAAAVEWSYQLLPADARRGFRQMSVFAGSFDLEALEAVAGPEDPDDDPDDDVLGWLTELVDNSLVLTERVPGGPMRYRMLEPVRQHAEAGLDRSGAGDATRRRHFDHYLALASRYNPWRRDVSARPVRLERLAQDESNLLAALDWAWRQPSDLGLRLGAASGQYFAYGGRVNDGLRWIEEALAKGTRDRGLQAEALAEAGQLAWRHGDYDLARTRLEEALTLAGELDDFVLSAWTLGLLSAVGFSAGHAEAAEHAQRAIDAYEACGDEVGVGTSLVSRAWTRYAQGDANGGDDDMRTALEVNERCGNATVTAYGHFGLNYGAALRGDAEAQRIHLAAALVGMHDGGVVERADWLALSAMLAALEDRSHSALRLLGGMDAWERRRGGSKSPAQLVLPFEALFERLFQRVDDTLAVELWTLGRQMHWDELVAEALEPRPRRSPLTPRENQIAQLIAEGLSNVDIAGRLVLSRRTVESHVDHIKQKLTLNSRNEIIVWALRESQPERDP
jgi:predicted ATPase/DNA-binding NarL/FixJ family response regulator